MKVTERGGRRKKGSVERSHTQRETCTSWLAMGGIGIWAQDEPE